MSNKELNIEVSDKLSQFDNIIEYGFCNKSTQLGFDHNIVTLKQIHSKQVHRIDHNTDYTNLQGDALITDVPGVRIGIYTADCVPVLLYDISKSVIGAVHAGWRGTFSDIISETVTAMKSVYNSDPEDIISVIGPCIGICCFEVDGDVAIKFIEKYEETDSFIYPNGEKYMIDLAQINKQSLKHAGLSNIEVIDICTKCDLGYHSYRREGAGVGRQLSFIGIKI